jgi:hypothetical protein
MNAPAPRSGRRPSLWQPLLRLLLALAMLLPVGVLYALTSQTADEDESLARRERNGVEYLRSLGPVTIALADAQSAAVTGRPVPRDALRTAMADATETDARLGDGLRTHERWAGLRATVGALPERSATNVETVLSAYGEAFDLLLGLYRRVRETSGLVHDPNADRFHLQNAAAKEAPECVVAAARLAGLVAVAPARPPDHRPRTVAELATARAMMLDSAGDLVSDLQAAVDETERGTLGGNLLSRLASYQRTMERLAAVGMPGDTGAAPDPAQAFQARSIAQAAAPELYTTMLTELDALLTAQIDELQTRRRLTAGAAAVALVLACTPVVAAVVAVRRPPAVRRAAGPLPDDEPDSQSARARWAGLLPANSAAAPPHRSSDPPDPVTPWEHSGATR